MYFLGRDREGEIKDESEYYKTIINPDRYWSNNLTKIVNLEEGWSDFISLEKLMTCDVLVKKKRSPQSDF